MAKNVDKCRYVVQHGKPRQIDGKCEGFCTGSSDEPCELCKICKLNVAYEDEQ